MPSAGIPTGARVEGAAQLRRTLKRAGVDMKDFTAINRKVAAVVLPVAKSTAPVGPPVRGHITTTIRAGATRSAAIIRVGTRARPYGPVIHWGWHRRNIKPNAWLSRAAQATEPRWSAVMFDGLADIIKKIEGS